MFKDLKNKFSELDLERMLSQINFDALTAAKQSVLDNLIKNISLAERIEITSWITSVENIHDDETLDTKEKRSRVKNLGASDIVSNFLKAALNILVGSIPLKNKDMLRMALTGATMLSSLVSKRAAVVTGVSLFALKQMMPQLTLSKSGMQFIRYLKGELESSMGEATANSEDDTDIS